MNAHVRYCVDCDEEYQPHVACCSDCGAVLQDKLASDEPEAEPEPDGPEETAIPREKYDTIAQNLPPATAEAVAPYLAAAGVTFRVEARHYGLSISVKPDDVAAAVAVLEGEGVLPRQPDPSQPAVAAEGGPCPACGTTISPGTDECPDCGLAVGGAARVCQRCGAELAPSFETCPDCAGREA
jgi:hypothetical protein